MKRIQECKKILESFKLTYSGGDKTWNWEGLAQESMTRRVSDLEYRIDTKIESMYASLEEEWKELSQYISKISIRDVNEEQEFQNFVLEELSVVNKGIQLEKRAREKTDEEVVSAINIYTNALQKGLRTANS